MAKEFLGRGWSFPVRLDAAGHIALSEYEEDIREAIRIVLLTAGGERVMRPDFGAGVKRMVFAPIRGVSETLVQATVFSALETWLGDVIKLEAVGVNVEEETMNIRIIYSLRTTPGRRILNLEATV